MLWRLQFTPAYIYSEMPLIEICPQEIHYIVKQKLCMRIKRHPTAQSLKLNAK